MSFSSSISAVPADKFAESVDAATIGNTDAESQALFAEAKEAVKALAERLPKFASGDVFVQGSISGHAVIEGSESSWGFNSLAVSVGETAIPKESVIEAAAEDEDPSATQPAAEAPAEVSTADEGTAEEQGTEQPEAVSDDGTAEPEAAEPEAVEAVEAEDAPVLTGQAARDEAARLAALADGATATGDGEADAQPEGDAAAA